MKYLKSFNEALTTDTLAEVKEFCEEHLIDLLDDGFKIEVHNAFYTRNNGEMGVPSKPKGHVPECLLIVAASGKLNWGDIKDRMIPFLECVSDEYKIKHNMVTLIHFYRMGYAKNKKVCTLDMLKGDTYDAFETSKIEMRLVI